jgi:hypothetical protein
MRIPPSPRRATQLALFQSSPRAPCWEQLPWEVRQQTLQLLARMLGEHSARTRRLHSSQEAGDE